MPKPNKSGYKVGYRKPPQETQFKQGKSGNPAGRPKGKLNLVTVLEHALTTRVVVNEGGRRLSKSKLEVAITQIANKAAGGELKAIQMMLNLLPIIDPASAGAALTPDLIADRELALKLALRLAGKSEENDDEK